MNLIWKIVWTVVIILVGPAAVHGLSGFLETTFEIFNTDEYLKWLLDFIFALILVLPAWFMWKGTHLIPIIFNLVVRIIIMVLILAIFPVIAGATSNVDFLVVNIPLVGEWNIFEFLSIAGVYFFSLWGIWVKS